MKQPLDVPTAQFADDGTSDTLASGAAAPSRGEPVLRVGEQVDVARWAEFVASHPNASIFHTPEMFSVFRQTRGHRPQVWAATDRGGQILALLTPVSISALRSPVQSLTTRDVVFGGPLVRGDGDGWRALEKLLHGYQRHARRRTLFAEMRNLDDAAGAASVISANGFAHENHLNFLVDLSCSAEEQWTGVASSARRNINKARREGVAVSEARTDAEIRSGYEVLRSVYSRIQVPLPDRSLFAASQRVLGPLGEYRMLLARFEGRTIGVLTLLLFKDVVYYWYTGTLREYARQRAGDLLVWHAIELGRELGFRTLDFGGAGRPDEAYGVRDFKAKYGGQLVDFGRDVWVPAPLRLRLATRGYETLRRFL